MPLSGAGDELPGGKADDGSPFGHPLEAVARFHDDARFALRHRLDVSGSAERRVDMTDQPFSHP